MNLPRLPRGAKWSDGVVAQWFAAATNFLNGIARLKGGTNATVTWQGDTPVVDVATDRIKAIVQENVLLPMFLGKVKAASHSSGLCTVNPIAYGQDESAASPTVDETVEYTNVVLRCGSVTLNGKYVWVYTHMGRTRQYHAILRDPLDALYACT